MRKFTVEILASIGFYAILGLIIWLNIKNGLSESYVAVAIGLMIFIVIFFSLKNFSDYRTEKGERSVLIPIVYSTFIIISTIVSLAVIVQLYITASTLWTLFCMTALIMLWYSFYLDKKNTEKGNKSIYVNYIALPIAKGFSALAEYPVLILEEKKRNLNIVNEKVVNEKEPIQHESVKEQVSEKVQAKKDFSEWTNYVDSKSLYRMTPEMIDGLIYDLENLGWNGVYTKHDVEQFISKNYTESQGWYKFKGINV